MASPVNPPRGMRDFLPAEMRRRRGVLEVIRSAYLARGFDEIETPAMEDSAHLHAGLGGDNEKLAFAVMKRAITRDQLRAAERSLDLADLGLRFDLTVPLARFYASHLSELPAVFRAIQIAPVWRAERPQKGRYRQFVQCDIDIIGESGAIAEVELITATVATLDALGLEGCRIRINDRRILIDTLRFLGFASHEHDGTLVTLDKLDKLSPAAVIAELRERGFTPSAIDALEKFLGQSTSRDASRIGDAVPFTEAAIREALPEGVDSAAIADLAAIGAAVNSVAHRNVVAFDPWLVRGMGYYTGAIFEVAHPGVGSSLGGGGRYDKMIGKFLGTDVAAVGFSLGFERIVDLVTLADAVGGDSVVLIHDGSMQPADLVSLQSQLVGRGVRVRLELKPRNMAPLLAQLAASGFSRYAFVSGSSSIDELEFRDISN